MRSYCGVIAGALALVVFSTPALAFVMPPPPPPPPPPAASAPSAPPKVDTVDHSGNRWHWGTEAWVRLGAGLAGNVILYAGHAKPSDYLLWNIGSAIWPGGGGALLALFQEDDGLVTNFLKRTWKCRLNDRRPRCAIWVMHHKALRHRRHRVRRSMPPLPRPRHAAAQRASHRLYAARR